MASAPVRTGSLHDPVDAQVGLDRGRRTDAHGLVGVTDVQSADIGIGVDGHRLDAHLPTGAHDAHGDLAPVGDEQAPEGWPGVPRHRRPCRRPVFAQRHQSGMLPCLRRRVRVALALEHLEGGDDARSRLGRHDDVVEVAATSGHVRVREALLVLVR